MSDPDVIICGSGATLDTFEFGMVPEEVPICAVSSAIDHVPRMPTHWVAMDRRSLFHQHTMHPAIVKHVSAQWLDWDCAPNRHTWTWDGLPVPRLVPVPGGPRRISQGVYRAPSSATAAVQIMAQLGYQSFLFVGCDFVNYAPVIVQELVIWQEHFQAAGIAWSVSSPYSMLARFMPIAGGVAV